MDNHIDITRASPCWDELQAPRLMENCPRFDKEGNRLIDTRAWATDWALEEIGIALVNELKELRDGYYELQGTLTIEEKVCNLDHEIIATISIDVVGK